MASADLEKGTKRNPRRNQLAFDKEAGPHLQHADSHHSLFDHDLPRFRNRGRNRTQSLPQPIAATDEAASDQTLADEDPLPKGITPKHAVEAKLQAERRRSEREGKPMRIQYDDDLVVFESEDDPMLALNWSRNKKLYTTALLGFTTMGATLSSSIYSSAIGVISEEYHISTEVATLGISLFIAGYVFGPICFAPISETYGRKISVVPAYFLFACFSAATAVSKDIQSIMITRFFGGLFASAPVSNVGGALADLYTAKSRGVAIVFYSFAVVGGPTLGPIIGAAVTNSYLGWRWTQYLVVIYASVLCILDVFFLSETYAPILLTQKAKALRLQTKQWALHSELETHDLNFVHFLEKNLTRPLVMLVQEPILLCVCLYNVRSPAKDSPIETFQAFTYGILYLYVCALISHCSSIPDCSRSVFAYDLALNNRQQAFPIIFEQKRGWKPVPASLPFLAVLVGVFIAGAINIAWSVYGYAPAFERGKGKVAPEMRLPPMMLGAVLFPAAFFWLGWTLHAHWINQVLAGGLVGIAFLLIFQTGINYLLDCFPKYAASAVAANTFLRSIFAAAFPLVAEGLFSNLGVPWACSMLGFIALGLAGVPWLFWIYGAKLRHMSRTAKTSN